MLTRPTVQSRPGLRPVLLAAAAALVLSACGGTETVGSDAPGSAVTSAAPDGAAAAAGPFGFTADTVDGSSVDTASFAGKPTVLWFWAPWCSVCRSEGPEVAAAAAALGSDVQVVGVAGRGEVPAMQGFVDDTGTGELQHLVDPDGSLWAKFGVVSQPSFAFVAKDGSVKLVQGSLGEQELEQSANELAAA